MVGGIASVLFFAPLEKRLGTTRLFRFSLPAYGLLIALMPLMNVAARSAGTASNWVVWMLLGFLLLITTASCLAYGSVFVFVTKSAPGKHNLGGTNGLAQTIIVSSEIDLLGNVSCSEQSFIRAVGPACSTALFVSRVDYASVF